MDSKYFCENFDDGLKKIEEKGGVLEFSKFLNSIEMPYRELYVDAFGTGCASQINEKYKDKLFRLEYSDGRTHDVGNLTGATFRNYSMCTMFCFKFKNSDGVTMIDTEYEQPKILMLEENKEPIDVESIHANIE